MNTPTTESAHPSWGVEVPHRQGSTLRQTLRSLLFASSIALTLVSGPTMASTTTLPIYVVTGDAFDAWGSVDYWWPNDFLPESDHSLGFDPGYYGGDPPDQQCSTWLAANSPPLGCDPNNAPEPVSFNGCGPEGAIGSTVPNLWFGSACNTHDVCYSQLDADKERCDQAFHQNMNRTCDNLRLIERQCEYSPELRRTICENVVVETSESSACRTAASVYWGSVESGYGWAWDRYNALHSQAACRNWHAQKDLASNCP